MRIPRRRPCRRHVFLSALRLMKQTFPRFTSFKDARNAHKNTRYNVLSAPRKRASDAPRERISGTCCIERVFQERGGFFAQETARAIAPSERNARSNANERAEIGAPLFLSYFFFVVFFKTTNTPLCCVVLRVVVVVVRYNMPCSSKGENNARVRLKTTDLFSYEQTRTKNNRKRTMKTSTEAEKRKSNALAAPGRNRSKRFTEQ